MKKLNKYLMLFVAALALVSCVDDVVETPSTEAKAGDEVQFGLTLPSTRTVYGDQDGNAYPIYWVNEDKVYIFSPDCLDGHRGAEYKVSVSGTEQNFANSLTKTGDSGVQWGDKDNAIFYSLYPSGLYALSGDGKIAKGIVVNYKQNIVVNGDDIKSDMEDCLLYAKNDGGEENGYLGVPKGQVVNLQYNPLTTVFMLTLAVADGSAEDYTIQSVSLIAPNGTDIAGQFGINVADGTFAEWGDNKSNSVSAAISDKATGGYHTLSAGDSVEIPLFIAPIRGNGENGSFSINGWKIEVKANNKTYTKTITDDLMVVPGQIHKVALPKFSSNKKEEWDVTKWMTYIPRNVYLSEISIPGTWNSLNVDCQSDTSIGNQYNKGVRAFHIDTRWRSDNNPLIGSSFTGITRPTITELSVAVGGSDKTNSYDGGNLMKKSSASTFSEYLKQITDKVQPDEYMVLFVTFAQNSYNGDRCPSTWYEAVSDVCDANEYVLDASTLTENSVVGDVLKRVIVVVNLDSSVDSTTLPADSKCLFTYVPMQLPQNHYDSGTSHTDELHYGTNGSSGISMYTSHAQISTTGDSAVNCGDRGYSHPLTSRDALVESFWDWSMSNYGTTNYNHDKWIYLGLGGYIMTTSGSSGSGYDTIENRYAPMIYNRIDAMGKNNVPYYPMGIMLMNNKKGSNYTATSGNTTTTLDYDFAGVCKQILLLNNKYQLQYDSSKPDDYINPNLTGEDGDMGGDDEE